MKNQGITPAGVIKRLKTEKENYARLVTAKDALEILPTVVDENTLQAALIVYYLTGAAHINGKNILAKEFAASATTPALGDRVIIFPTDEFRIVQQKPRSGEILTYDQWLEKWSFLPKDSAALKHYEGIAPHLNNVFKVLKSGKLKEEELPSFLEAFKTLGKPLPQWPSPEMPVV